MKKIVKYGSIVILALFVVLVVLGLYQRINNWILNGEIVFPVLMIVGILIVVGFVALVTTAIWKVLSE